MMVGVHPLRLSYVVLFAAAALVCFGAIGRARARLEDPDTRWGLTALLATCGLWAGFQVGRLVAPGSTLKVAFYVLGLVAGLATVGAWLYFCSAYAGTSYHRHAGYRWLAVGVYAAVVAVKLTSPVHGLYFSTATAATPFPHLVIRLGALHWIVTGLAYALSAVGFYMLFDLFQESSHATARLGLLVGLAGLPVVFDLVSYLHPGAILTLNYEPVGVALFALGVLYVADGSFLAVRQFGREQLLDELDEGIVLLDADGVVRDANDAARRLFPALADGVGERLGAVVPETEAYRPADDPRIVEFDEFDPPRYYLLSSSELTAGRTTIGRTLVFKDVTDVERHRREVERQRSQLDSFAEALTHELRNALNIAQGHARLVETRLADADPTVRESLTTLAETGDRMTSIVDDLATLARFGRRVENPTSVRVASVARRAWEPMATDGVDLAVEADGTVRAAPDRLERLFANLFEFAVTNGATRITLARTDGELVVADDGSAIAEADVDGAFAYGQAVPDAESGMLLPVVRTLAEAHGWEVTVDTEHGGRVRIRTSG